MRTGQSGHPVVARRSALAISVGHALGTVSTVLAISMVSGAALAESGCPTGFVPNGTETLANPAFANGFNGFTTDPAMFKAPVGDYPTDGNGSVFPNTGIGVMTGTHSALPFVSQIAFPGDLTPPGGLPAVPATPNWLAFNGNDAGAPTMLWEQTINGLKPNTDYAFTAYFSNVLAPGFQAGGFVAPLVEFQVNGTQLGSDIPVCDSGSGLNTTTNACATEATTDAWQRLGITVSTGGATSATLSVHDKQVTSSSGNDFAMSLISFQECVPIGTPDIAVSPASVVFPAFTLGGTKTTTNVTVSNAATGTLTIGTIPAPTNADFTIATDGCSERSLTAGQSCVIGLDFSTATAGAKTSTLVIPSNDPDEATVTASLSGTASVAPVATNPILSVVPATSVLLPEYTLGGAPTSSVVTVSNIGTGVLTLGNVAAPANADFTIVNENCSGQSLSSQQSCTITLNFAANTAGNKFGSLVIPAADPGVAPVTLALSGRAAEAAPGEVLTRLEGGIGGGAAGLPLLLAMGGALAFRRRRWAALTGLLGVSLGASFGAQAAPGQFYIGGGVGQSRLEPEVVNIPSLTVDDKNDVGYKLFLGYDILRWLSIEGFASKLGAAGFSNGGEIDYNAFGAGLVANFPSNSPGLTFLAKLGLAEIDNKGHNITFREVEGTEIYGGLGAEYQFQNGFSLRGEYEFFDEDAQLISMSLLKRFGGAKPKPVPVAAVVAPVVKAEPPPPPKPKPAPVAPKMVVLQIESIFFDTDRHVLKPEAIARLNEVTQLMNAYPDLRMTLVGHADERGSDDYNLGLSLRRAKEAAKYLEQQGIMSKRLAYEARGERDPRDPRSLPEAWSQNRRVDFFPDPREVVERK
ncbi:MAG: choice-of-anchor D domain-containing protein [Thiotrichales bacterium]